MLTAKLKFRCKLCNNAQSFYIMPMKERVGKNDYINSPTRYNIQCKKCGKNYILKFSVRAV